MILMRYNARPAENHRYIVEVYGGGALQEGNGLIFNVRKEVGARLWSQLTQRKKGTQKFGKSGDLKYAIYTSIFQITFPYRVYEFVKEKLH
jgi:hypothetical protein